jgi:hypothetical protein
MPAKANTPAADPAALARLYDLADQYHAMAPWQELYETDLVAVRHPRTGETAYLSVMGRDGTHCALAAYLGADALSRFNLIQETNSKGTPFGLEDSVALILESRQLQVAFATRAELAKPQLDAIKRLGRKYRGDNWPKFDSYQPGYAPNPLDAGEIEWLTIALEQFLKLVSRGDPSLAVLHRRTSHAKIPCREQVEGAWRDGWIEMDATRFCFPTPPADPALVARVAAHPRATRIDCSFALVPAPTGPYGKRIFPYLLISADAASGMVLGCDLLSVEAQTHAEMIASAPAQFLRQWDRARLRPAAIRVTTHTTGAILAAAARALGVPLTFHNRLPSLEAIKQHLPF